MGPLVCWGAPKWSLLQQAAPGCASSCPEEQSAGVSPWGLSRPTVLVQAWTRHTPHRFLHPGGTWREPQLAGGVAGSGAVQEQACHGCCAL